MGEVGTIASVNSLKPWLRAGWAQDGFAFLYRTTNDEGYQSCQEVLSNREGTLDTPRVGTGVYTHQSPSTRKACINTLNSEAKCLYCQSHPS